MKTISMALKKMTTDIKERGEVVNIGGALVAVRLVKGKYVSLVVLAEDSVKITHEKGVWDNGFLVGVEEK